MSETNEIFRLRALLLDAQTSLDAANQKFAVLSTRMDAAQESSERVIIRCTNAGWVSGLEFAAAEYERAALEEKKVLDHFYEQRDVESYCARIDKYENLMSVVKRLRAIAATHREG